MRAAGHAPAAGWGHERLDDATPADGAHVHAYASQVDGSDLETLLVELDDDGRLTRIIGVEETPWRIVGGGMRDGTPYVACKRASLPLGHERAARKARVTR